MNQNASISHGLYGNRIIIHIFEDKDDLSTIVISIVGKINKIFKMI